VLASEHHHHHHHDGELTVCSPTSVTTNKSQKKLDVVCCTAGELEWTRSGEIVRSTVCTYEILEIQLVSNFMLELVTTTFIRVT
jgi:hypothetical protein